jgi:CBS domain containing-hemolysin-like protein
MPDDSRQSSNATPPQPGFWSRIGEMIGLRSASVRDDIADALSQPALHTDLTAKERAMLRNVLALREHRVIDVMVPRADIVAVAADTSLGELLRIFRTANHSRLPVYGETLDDPRGMIHIRDFLDFLASRSKTRRRKGQDVAAPQALDNIDLSLSVSAARILRPVLYVPPSMPAVDLLVRMQATRTHMALVIDEYGGTDGLISIEDLVEIIVGEIEDEHDLEEAPMVSGDAEGRIVADARVPLAQLSSSLGVDLAAMELAEEVDTLGGLVTSLAGRVPVRGEIVMGPQGLEFEVMDADPRKLKRVRIHIKADKAEEAATPPPPAPPSAAAG